MDDVIINKDIEYPTRTVHAYVGFCWFPGCEHKTPAIFNKEGCRKTLYTHYLRIHRRKVKQ